MHRARFSVQKWGINRQKLNSIENSFLSQENEQFIFNTCISHRLARAGTHHSNLMEKTSRALKALSASVRYVSTQRQRDSKPEYFLHKGDNFEVRMASIFLQMLDFCLLWREGVHTIILLSPTWYVFTVDLTDLSSLSMLKGRLNLKVEVWRTVTKLDLV